MQTHATALANTTELLGENGVAFADDRLSSNLVTFRAAFAEFIETLELSGYPRNFLDDMAAPATKAYCAFFKAHEIYEKSI